MCISKIKKLLSNINLNSKKEIMWKKEKIEVQNIKIKRMEKYLIHLKRKIIEILIKQIIKENKEYIDNFTPNEILLKELKKDKIKNK